MLGLLAHMNLGAEKRLPEGVAKKDVKNIKIDSNIDPKTDEQISFTVNNDVKQYSTVKCLMVCVGNSNELLKVAKLLKFDLEFTDQLDVEIKKHDTELDAEKMANLSKQGFSLCLSLKELAKNESNKKDDKKDSQKNSKKNNIKNNIEVAITLKDPSTSQVFFEKKVSWSDKTAIFDAHTMADQLLPVLTGEKGPMLSTLAYCEQLSSKHKIICIADYACMKKRILVQNYTLNVAPCWHSKAPILFFSQFTRRNSRLMSIDIASKKQSIVCSYDGLNMQPSFSQDGIQAVLCLSGSGNSELYFYDQTVCNKLKKRIFTPLTHNKGSNVSPCLLPNGDVVFCSDFETGYPQIYYLDQKKKSTRVLTSGRGYCASPSYCINSHAIIYSRYVRGVFQLFSLDIQAKKPRERQLTFSTGDKLDPVWSPCGKYAAFSYNCPDKKGQQIATLNCRSGKIKVLTTGKEPKSFPSWTGMQLF